MTIDELAAFCDENKLEFEVYFKSHILGDSKYRSFNVVIRLPVSYKNSPCAWGDSRQSFEVAAKMAYNEAVAWYASQKADSDKKLK